MDEVVTYAEVNWGRWIVRCPFCPSAQLASRSARWFLCHFCGNKAVGGQWIPLVWPDNVSEIEAALSVRPPNNMNWIPGETVEDLLKENEKWLGQRRERG